MRGQVQPDGGGRPFNIEPATDPHVSREIDFDSCGQHFRLLLSVPLYIWEKLKQSDWGQVEQWVKQRADAIRQAEALRGNLLHWQERLEAFARTCLYNQFSKAQISAGNDSWGVPEGWL